MPLAMLVYAHAQSQRESLRYEIHQDWLTEKELQFDLLVQLQLQRMNGEYRIAKGPASKRERGRIESKE